MNRQQPKQNAAAVEALLGCALAGCMVIAFFAIFLVVVFGIVKLFSS